MKKPAESLPVFRKSLPVQQEVAAMRPGKYRYRELTAMVYQREADAYRLLDKPAEAAASTDKRRRLWTIEAEPLIGVAADLAQCISLVGKGKDKLSDEEQAERQHYADEVLEILHEAQDRGYTAWAKVAEDDKFAPVRERAEFKKLTAVVKP